MAQTIEVMRFNMGNVEDPEIYAAAPILDWQKTNLGKWIMERALEQPTYHIVPCPETYGYLCKVTAILRDEDVTFYKLAYQ